MKKRLVFVLILFMCFIGINDAKADVGEGNVGTAEVMCKYCYGNDCYYVFQNKSASKLTGTVDKSFTSKLEKDTNKRQYLYHNEYDTLIVSDDDGKVRHLVFLFNPSDCSEKLYYVKRVYDTSARDGVIYYYIMTDSNDEYNSAYGYNGWNTTYNEEKLVYKLVGVYGRDVYGTSMDLVINRMKDVYDTSSNESGVKIVGSEGCAILTEPIMEKLNWALNFIKYGGAALAILLGAFDFMKAVLSDEENATKKAAGNLVKRLAAAILIFLLPLLIQFVLTTVEIEGLNVDAPTCGVGVSE